MERQMIPKIIHYCWYGGKDLPEEYATYINEWKKVNRGYKIMRWDESNGPMHLPYMKKASSSGHWTNMSNLTRLYALLKHGGIYLDTDVKAIRSFNPLLNNACFFGFEDGEEGSDNFWVNSAICGAVPGHPFIQLCYDEVLKRFEGTEAENEAGPRVLTQILKEKRNLKQYGYQKLKDLTLYPTEFFYPISYREVYKTRELERYISDKTIAVHMWGRTWYTPKMLLDIIDDLQMWAATNAKTISNLQQHLAHQKQQLQELNDKLHVTQQEGEKVIADLEISRVKEIQLTERLEEAANEKRSFIEERRRSEDLIAALSGELRSALSHAKMTDDQSRARDEEHRREQEKISAQLLVLREELVSLKAAHQVSETEVARLQENDREKEEQLKQFQEREQRSQMELHMAQAILAERSAWQKRLEEDHALIEKDLKQQIAALQENGKAHETWFKEELRRLQEENNRWQLHQNEEVAKSAARERERGALEKTLAMKEQELKDKQAEMKARQISLQDQVNEMLARLGEITKVAKERDLSMEKKIAERDADLVKAVRIQNELNAKQAELHEKLRAVDKEKSHNEKELEASRRDIDRLKREEKEVIKVVAGLRERIALVEHYCETLQKQNKELPEQFFQKEKQLMYEIGKKDQVLKELQKYVGDLNAELEQKEQAYTDLAKKKSELLNSVASLEQSLAWYTSTYENRKLAGIIKDRVFKRKKN